MKMKKTAIAAVLMLAALLTACGNTESSTAGIETTTSASDTTTAETTTATAETTAETETTAEETTTAAADTTAEAPAETTAAQSSEAEQTEAQQTEQTSGGSFEELMKRTEANVLAKLGAGYKIRHIEEVPHNPEDELVFLVSVVKENDPDAQEQTYMANDRICMTQEEYAAQID